MLQLPSVDLGEVSWFARDSAFIATLGAAVDSPLGPQVLALFQAMTRWQGERASTPSIYGLT